MSVKHAFGRLVPPTHDEAVERVTIARAAALRLAERALARVTTAGTQCTKDISLPWGNAL